MNGKWWGVVALVLLCLVGLTAISEAGCPQQVQQLQFVQPLAVQQVVAAPQFVVQQPLAVQQLVHQQAVQQVAVPVATRQRQVVISRSQVLSTLRAPRQAVVVQRQFVRGY